MARTILLLLVSQLMTLTMGQWFQSSTSVFNTLYHKLLNYTLICSILIMFEVKSGISSSICSKIHLQYVEFFSISFYCRDLVFQKIQEVASQLLTSLSTNLRWNGSFTCTIYNGFNGQCSAIIKVFRASSFKVDP